MFSFTGCCFPFSIFTPSSLHTVRCSLYHVLQSWHHGYYSLSIVTWSLFTVPCSWSIYVHHYCFLLIVDPLLAYFFFSCSKCLSVLLFYLYQLHLSHSSPTPRTCYRYLLAPVPRIFSPRGPVLLPVEGHSCCSLWRPQQLSALLFDCRCGFFVPTSFIS
jgi:hypothetical protein